MLLVKVKDPSVVGRILESQVLQRLPTILRKHSETKSIVKSDHLLIKQLFFASCSVPHLTEIHPSKLEVTLLDHFPVSFGVEGGSISLVCSMVVIPNLPNLPPLAQWYRDGKTSQSAS